MTDGPRQQIRVLHVDDNADFVETAAAFLGRTDGLTVTTETSPTAALDCLATDKPPIDCVVSDYEMPGMNGLEFLERIREDHPALPFILYTGKGSEEIASEAISAGVTDYLQKEGGTDQYTILANRITNAVTQARGETSLEQSEERYRRLVETSPVPIILFDADGTVRYTNAAAATFLAVETPADLVGTAAIDLIHPDEQDTARQRVERLLDQREPVPERELRIVDHTGTTKHAVSAITPVTYDDEAAGQVVLQDITAYKRTVADLEAEQQFIDTVLDALDDIFLFTSPTGELRRWNDRLNEITGYTD